MTEKIQIGLRVTPETRDKLIIQAEKENRSVNNLIENIIKKYLITPGIKIKCFPTFLSGKDTRAFESFRAPNCNSKRFRLSA